IGTYGGTLSVGITRMEIMGWGDIRMVNGDFGENWLRISKDLQRAEPNVLKDWEVSDDLTQVTCYMRKGLKFSDGEPCTSENIRFWWDDIINNTELTPVPNVWLRPGGELAKLEIIDDYTYRLTFKVPHPAFVLVSMAHFYGTGYTSMSPYHYLKQFHIKYNEKANDLAKAAGFDFWYQHFLRQHDPIWNLERPRLTPYQPVKDTPSMVFWERNPYYAAVDPEGNQLPYIDEVHSDRCADLSVYDAKLVGGAFDFAAFESRILFYATYAEGAALGNADMVLWPSGKGGEVVYNVNMNWADDEMREVFSDDRFRQALSLAVDRADINNVIYFGNASETQMTVIPASRHYKPEYAEAYAQFDRERANALLDEMGLEWNAEKTHRLWPTSKKPMIISWDLVETETPKGPITELVTEYWKAIGIEIQWKSITRQLLTQKIGANEEPMSTWHGDETADTLFLRRPKFFAPIDGDESVWAPLWGRWYNTLGSQGEEPPEMIKDLYTWLDEYMLTDSNEPAARVLESQAEHVWTIGTVGNAPHPLWIRKTLKNVSQTGGFWTWDSLWTFTEYAEQWYLTES
ncbi:MAG: hypothetical protein GXY79_05760, partial [Chloroflexi bacterium]|nr:hypothetical protein [Chloroflexota bacterium]